MASWCICWTALSNWQNRTPPCLTCGRCAHHTCARWFRLYFHNKYCHPNARVCQLQGISCLAFQACMPSSNHKVRHQLWGNRIVSYNYFLILYSKDTINSLYNKHFHDIFLKNYNLYIFYNTNHIVISRKNNWNTETLKRR